MSIIERVRNASSLIKAVGAVIVLFPGIAVLIGIVDIPPSLADMVNLIAYSVCAAVLLVVFLLDDRIRRMSNLRAALLGIGGVVLGSACVLVYFDFANDHVVEISAPEGAENKFITPRTPKREILEIVDPAVPGDPSITEYKTALEGSVQNERLKELMKDHSGSSMLVMIILLVLSEVLLIAPVVAIAWKLISGPPETAAPG